MKEVESVQGTSSLLGEDDIREFADLWRQEFNEVLAPNQARTAATAVLELYALLAQATSPPRSEPPEA